MYCNRRRCVGDVTGVKAKPVEGKGVVKVKAATVRAAEAHVLAGTWPSKYETWMGHGQGHSQSHSFSQSEYTEISVK